MKNYIFTKLLVVTILLIGVCAFYPSLTNAGTIADNFDGASLNNRLWDQWSTDPDQWSRQEGGQLKIGINAASTGSIFGAGVNGAFQLKGNFEIMVDYNFIKWPDSNGVRMGLRYNGQSGARHDYANKPDKDSIINPQGYNSTNFIDGSYNNVSMSPTIATSGRLKLTRVGFVMTGYYLQDSNWVQLGSHDYSVTGALPEWLGTDLSAWSHTSVQQPDGHYVYPFAGKDVEIAFDNFQVTYDQIRYFSNSGYVPLSLLLDSYQQ